MCLPHRTAETSVLSETRKPAQKGRFTKANSQKPLRPEQVSAERLEKMENRGDYQRSVWQVPCFVYGNCVSYLCAGINGVCSPCGRAMPSWLLSNRGTRGRGLCTGEWWWDAIQSEAKRKVAFQTGFVCMVKVIAWEQW